MCMCADNDCENVDFVLDQVVLDRLFFCLFECVQTVMMLILCLANRCSFFVVVVIFRL